MAAAPAAVPPAADPSRRAPSRQPASESNRRPSLRVVEPPRRARRWLAATLITILVGVAAIASLSAASAETAFVASELERDIATLERARDTLTGDVAELSSLERIRQVATEELDMVPAEQARYLDGPPADYAPASHDEEPADPVKAARERRW